MNARAAAMPPGHAPLSRRDYDARAITPFTLYHTLMPLLRLLR